MIFRTAMLYAASNTWKILVKKRTCIHSKIDWSLELLTIIHFQCRWHIFLFKEQYAAPSKKRRYSGSLICRWPKPYYEDLSFPLPSLHLPFKSNYTLMRLHHTCVVVRRSVDVRSSRHLAHRENWIFSSSRSCPKIFLIGSNSLQRSAAKDQQYLPC